MFSSKIPTILGIFVLMVGVAVGVLLIQERSIYRLGAAPSTMPQDVRVSNVTQSSFTVSWVTEADTVGFVNWGDTQSVSNIEQGEDLTSNSVHYITVSGLEPQKTYFFSIDSAGDTYMNNGDPWSIKTPSVNGLSNSNVISGTVVDPFGEPIGGAVVYVSGAGLSNVSSRTSSGGAFIINLSGTYNANLTAPAQLVGSSVLDIFVQGGPLGIAQARVELESANPIPTMTLGTSYDFVNSLPADTNSTPESNLIIPEVEELNGVNQGQTIFRAN